MLLGAWSPRGPATHPWLCLQRPIVEFSLEDRRKLKLKEQRAQRSLVGARPVCVCVSPPLVLSPRR